MRKPKGDELVMVHPKQLSMSKRKPRREHDRTVALLVDLKRRPRPPRS